MQIRDLEQSPLMQAIASIPMAAKRRVRRATRVDAAGRFVHLIGAIAMMLGLFLPIAGGNGSLAAPQDDVSVPQAVSQDIVPAGVTQVVAFGDFQSQVGCGDGDAFCSATALGGSGGIWSGNFGLSPGSYQVQFSVFDQNGNQFIYGSGGQNGGPIGFTVNEGQPGAFFLYNEHTNEVQAESIDAFYTVQTDFGTFVPTPAGGTLDILVESQGGSTNVQLLSDGVPVADPQQAQLSPGWTRISLDASGNVVNSEGLPYGTLAIQRLDADGNPAGGGCYQLYGNELVNQACADGSGSAFMIFPQGLNPGSYTLVEVQAPVGQEALQDQPLDLQSGDQSVTVQPEGEEVVEEPTVDDGNGEATEEPDADPTGEPVETSVGTDGFPSPLVVTIQDEQGNPVPGVCWQLIQDGDVIQEECDLAERGDTNPGNGRTGFDSVPPGEYTLRQSDGPEGVPFADDDTVTIPGDGSNVDAFVTVEAAQPTEEPEAAAGDVVVLRSDEVGDPAGGACFEIQDDNGNAISQEVCDDDGDQADDGRTGFFDVPDGSWWAHETRTPDGVEPAQDVQFSVIPNDSVNVQVQSAAIVEEPTEEAIEEPTEEVIDEPTEEATEEPTDEVAEIGSLQLDLYDPDGNLVGGACWQLIQDDAVVAEGCDIDNGIDRFPFNGKLGLYDVPVGSYTLRMSEAPDGYEAVDDVEVEITATDALREVTIQPLNADQPTEEATEEATEVPVAEATEEPTEEATEVPTQEATEAPTEAVQQDPGVLIVTLQDENGNPIGGACFELVDGEDVVADSCDLPGQGDDFPNNGRTGFFSAPAGTHQLRQVGEIDGFQPVEQSDVTIQPNQQTDVTLTAESDASAGDPAETPEQVTETPGEPTEIPGDQPGVPVGITGVLFDASGVDLGGQQLCVQLDTTGGIGMSNPPAACDNDGADGETQDGIVLLEDVPSGTYAFFVTSGPAELEQTDWPNVTVEDGQVTDVPLQQEAPAPPEPEPGSLLVQVADENGDPVGQEGTCVTVVGATDSICDGQDGDSAPDIGEIGIEAIPAGEYDVSMDTVPEGYEPAGALQGVSIAAGEQTSETLTLVASSGGIQIVAVNQNGQPVGGACWELLSNESVEASQCDDNSNGGTVNDGFATFTGLQPGDYTLRMASAPDSFEVVDDQSVTVASGDNDPVQVTLSQANGSVRVTIVADGEALDGVCVSLADAVTVCDNQDGDADSDTGVVQIDGVAPGDYTVAIDNYPAGYDDSGSQQVTIVAGETAELAFDLSTSTGSVSAAISTGDAPVEGVCLSIGDRTVCDNEDGDANPDPGTIQIDGLATADYTAAISGYPEGYNDPGSQPVTVVANEVADLTFDLNESVGSIRAEILDPDGAVGGACLGIVDGQTVCDNQTDDSDPAIGAIQIDGIVPGDYSAAIDNYPAGYEDPGAQQVTVVADEVADLVFDLVLLPPATAGLTVFVQTVEGDAVASGCVTLSQQDAVVIGPVCDNSGDDSDPADGAILFEGVEAGSYVARMTDDSTANIPGYQDSDAPSVTVTEDTDNEGVITVSIAETPATGSLELITRNNVSNYRVAGACYQFTGTDGSETVCDNDVDDLNPQDGVIQLVDLPAGDYALVMSTTPAGYATPAEMTVTVEVNGDSSYEIRLDPLPDDANLTVFKVDPNDDPLGNSCFALRQGKATTATRCDSTDSNPNDGTLVFNDVPAGTYTLAETRTPSSGYSLAAPVTVKIVAGADKDVTVVNYPKPGRVVVTKVNANDASELLLNACFALEGERNYGPFCDSDDGHTDSRIVFANVAAGDYTLVETSPPPGYVVSGDRDVSIAPGATRYVSVANEPAPPPAEKGDLAISKVDTGGDSLAGSCFRLYHGNAAITGQVCDRADGASDGTIRFSDVPAGTWTLRETVTPTTDYEYADLIDVTIQNNRTTEVEVENTLKPGRLQVNKTNTDGKALQGACFDLAEDTGGARCTDAYGVAVFSGLEPGLYTLVETQAPFGYEQNPDVVDIPVKPGQTKVVNVVDERTPPPANTGSVQIQKFYCPAGKGGERTDFFGGAQGSQQLARTAGCERGDAVFTLIADQSEGGPGEIRTGTDGQYQSALTEGIYRLTETDPDLEGNSTVRVRVNRGQMTTVIVINYLAPPEPDPITANVSKYTCSPSFDGTRYEDFAASCSTDQQLTNTITIRLEGPVTTKGVTGDGGERGKTSFEALTPGEYTIFEDRPFGTPTDYLFCGLDSGLAGQWKAVNGSVTVTLDYGQTLNCSFHNIPEVVTEDTGTILVRKFVCEIKSPPKGYAWEEECGLSHQSASFSLAAYNAEMQDYGEPVTAQANLDGFLRSTNLQPGNYRLLEVDGVWCHAESNSVNASGDVVVTANTLSEVWIYNCVEPQTPPNTGSGDAATNPPPVVLPGASDAPVGEGPEALPSVAFPFLAAGAWLANRRRAA